MTLSRILMVEDDPDIQVIAQLALEALGGFSVELCNSGYDALPAAIRFQPDLILLDVMMPGMDGLTTLRKLQSQPQTQMIPVIFLTAKVQYHEIDRYRKLGALDVIIKPFDPMALSATITSIWKRVYG